MPTNKRTSPVTDKVYSLEELSRLTGVLGRTIRYYIAEGLLPGACSTGRSSTYSDEHLQKLQKIADLRKLGNTLAMIRVKLVDQPKPPAVTLTVTHFGTPLFSPGELHVIAPDLQVLLIPGVDPKRTKVLRHALAEFTKAVKMEN